MIQLNYPRGSKGEKQSYWQRHHSVSDVYAVTIDMYVTASDVYVIATDMSVTGTDVYEITTDVHLLRG